jgi:hypothetical protein
MGSFGNGAVRAVDGEKAESTCSRTKWAAKLSEFPDGLKRPKYRGFWEVEFGQDLPIRIRPNSSDSH